MIMHHPLQQALFFVLGRKMFLPKPGDFRRTAVLFAKITFVLIMTPPSPSKRWPCTQDGGRDGCAQETANGLKIRLNPNGWGETSR
jgi:hypothetical protein